MTVGINGLLANPNCELMSGKIFGPVGFRRK
jgi:hypothetical protein